MTEMTEVRLPIFESFWCKGADHANRGRYASVKLDEVGHFASGSDEKILPTIVPMGEQDRVNSGAEGSQVERPNQ